MVRWIHGFVLAALATILFLTPALAADGPAPAAPGLPSAASPAESAPSPAADPAVMSGTETAPPTAQSSQQPEQGKMTNEAKRLRSEVWIGAGIGLTVGLINGHHEVETTLIGAASPFIVRIALGLLGSIRPPGMLRERPTDLHVLGEPVRGKLGQILPRALGAAALGLAANGGAGERGSGRLLVKYTIRW